MHVICVGYAIGEILIVVDVAVLLSIAWDGLFILCASFGIL